ncbi:YrrS family protein [Neobacillus fumarioli]|uniref:YrrS family protein n=1 Tax=Neobacillus fumarioli TaxID=105229 RepID=UPI000AF179A9
MNHDIEQNSRSGYRKKRKKTNLVLNSLIVIVLLLIIFVGYKIFASGNDNASAPKKETPKTEQKQSSHKEKNSEDAAKKGEANSSGDAAQGNGQSGENSGQTDSAKSNQPDQSQAVVTDGGSSPNVIKSTINPAWKPIGTSQTGEHTTSYDSNSVDWQEMLNAISYATGLDPSNMTVYWLGRDRSQPNASIGTVYSKDKQQKYRVYIKWVDGQGWMPTKVEELARLQK